MTFVKIKKKKNHYHKESVLSAKKLWKKKKFQNSQTEKMSIMYNGSSCKLVFKFNSY